MPRSAILSVVLGLALFLALAVALVALSLARGRDHRGWTCDDTPYNETMPDGRQVIGPTVRPIPGCGD